MDRILCWLLHRHVWEILTPGILPLNIDAVVFCWKCDRCRGRGIRVLQINPQPAL